MGEKSPAPEEEQKCGVSLFPFLIAIVLSRHLMHYKPAGRCGGHHSAYRVWESKEADKKNTNNERGDLRSKDSEISDLKSELGGVKKQLDEITNVTQVTGPSMGSNSGHSQAMSFGRMAGLRGTMLPRWGNVFLSCQADEDGCIRHLPCPEVRILVCDRSIIEFC